MIKIQLFRLIDLYEIINIWYIYRMSDGVKLSI